MPEVNGWYRKVLQAIESQFLLAVLRPCDPCLRPSGAQHRPAVGHAYFATATQLNRPTQWGFEPGVPHWEQVLVPQASTDRRVNDLE